MEYLDPEPELAPEEPNEYSLRSLSILSDFIKMVNSFLDGSPNDKKLPGSVLRVKAIAFETNVSVIRADEQASHL